MTDIVRQPEAITQTVVICSICGDYPKQVEVDLGTWKTEAIELVRCPACGRVVCHACHDDRDCCAQDEVTEPVIGQKELF